MKKVSWTGGFPGGFLRGIVAALLTLLALFCCTLAIKGAVAFEDGVQVAVLLWLMTIVLGYLLGAGVVIVISSLLGNARIKHAETFLILGVSMALLMWAARGLPATSHILAKFLPEPWGLVVSILFAVIIAVGMVLLGGKRPGVLEAAPKVRSREG